MNRLLLDALSGNNHSQKMPVWLMRQAGRYLVEYQDLRKRYSFMELIHSKDLIVEITKMPIDIFGFDAAIIFSDILLICEYLGQKLHFEEGSGPHLEPALSSAHDVDKLIVQQSVQVPFLTDAIRELKKSLKVPLLGFAGAPFTVASYMIEGKSSSTLRKTKKWLLEDPVSFHKLLDLIATKTIEYLNLQIDAGVDAVQLFDTWAEKFSWNHFHEFSAVYLKKVMDGIKKCPSILFCKGSSAFASALAKLQPAAVSLDWQCDIAKMRKIVGPNVCLQGNLDPDILLTTPEIVRREVLSILDVMKQDPAFIFNLGHGILPETPRKNVEALVECLRN